MLVPDGWAPKTSVVVFLVGGLSAIIVEWKTGSFGRHGNIVVFGGIDVFGIVGMFSGIVVGRVFESRVSSFGDSSSLPLGIAILSQPGLIVGLGEDLSLARVSVVSFSGKGGMMGSVVDSARSVVLTLLVVVASSRLGRVDRAALDEFSSLLTSKLVCGPWVLVMWT